MVEVEVEAVVVVVMGGMIIAISLLCCLTVRYQKAPGKLTGLTLGGGPG